jgi:hypothetical protein
MRPGAAKEMETVTQDFVSLVESLTSRSETLSDPVEWWSRTSLHSGSSAILCLKGGLFPRILVEGSRSVLGSREHAKGRTSADGSHPILRLSGRVFRRTNDIPHQ